MLVLVGCCCWIFGLRSVTRPRSVLFFRFLPALFICCLTRLHNVVISMIRRHVFVWVAKPHNSQRGDATKQHHSWLVAFYLLMGFLFSINIIHTIQFRFFSVARVLQQRFSCLWHPRAHAEHDIFLLLYHPPTLSLPRFASPSVPLVYTCNLNVENWRNSFTLIFSSSLYLLLFMRCFCSSARPLVCLPACQAAYQSFSSSAIVVCVEVRNGVAMDMVLHRREKNSKLPDKWLQLKWKKKCKY